MHWLMVARPAPLEGLKVRVGGKGYEFLHEAVAVAESTVSCRWPNTTLGVLKEWLVGDTECLTIH